MPRIVLATPRPETWQAFAAALCSDPEVHFTRVVSGAAALEAARASAPHLVIIDSDLPDTRPLDLVRKLLTLNAMVNTAVVSSLPEEEFHEASEGLGVLGRLPVAPDKIDAAGLLQKLRKVMGKMA